MGQNIRLTEKVLTACVEAGVKEFCLCAGARNSPLVMTLAKAEGIRIFHFFDERSAAFFALGRIKNHQQPVAVITTSGTAVAELLPATVEAHYAGLPLILITADRPRAYRGRGAPQAIEQVGIFSHYVEKAVDVADSSADLSFRDWSRQRPVQINVCFAEPLIDADIPALQFQNIKTKPTESSHFKPNAKRVSLSKPIVIVGALRTVDAMVVQEFLAQHGLPVYAEAQSNLRGLKGLHFLQNGDKLLSRLVKDGVFESVLRIGGVPTLRFWRDLEDQLVDLPVVTVSNDSWSGLARSSELLQGFEHLQNLEISKPEASSLQKLLKMDSQITEARAQLREKYPRSEVSLMQQLSERIRSTDRVYLGNSLPIREWDVASSVNKKFQAVEANRGANGIDGQVSTFLGWSEPAQTDCASWGVFGDLTALYDLSAPWITPQLKPGFRRIVVMNNSGGQIFKNMFQNPTFLNAHDLDFKSWAEQWRWSYKKITDFSDSFDSSAAQLILELVPDAAQSDAHNKADQAL